LQTFDLMDYIGLS